MTNLLPTPVEHSKNVHQGVKFGRNGDDIAKYNTQRSSSPMIRMTETRTNPDLSSGSGGFSFSDAADGG